MSAHEMALSFDQFTLASRSDAKAQAFRIVLLPGQLLRVPRAKQSLRILSGHAWVSHRGLDHTLTAGQTLPLAGARHEALVSGEGETLLLEIA